MKAELMVCVTLAALAGGCPDEGRKPLGATCGEDDECASGLCLEARCVDPEADDDGDGLVNRVEGQLGTSPTRVDTDGDGTPDIAEIDFATLTNRDSDGDGKPDAVESATADADQDCIPDQMDADDASTPDPTCGEDNAGDFSCGGVLAGDP